MELPIRCLRHCELFCRALRWSLDDRFVHALPIAQFGGRGNHGNFNPSKHRLGAEVAKKGVVMFPTSHDITPNFLPQAVTTIRNLLVRNKVLVVTKPHLSVVEALCQEFAEHKADIQFRFTVGALSEEVCGFWEPGAPTPGERVQALKHAYRKGFQTSVSIEPMLDSVENTLKLVAMVTPFVTDTIWLGKMNRCPQKTNAHVPGFSEALSRIAEQQTDAEIFRLVGLLTEHPKVRWKDSIKEVIAAQN